MIKEFIVGLYGESTYVALGYFFSFYPLWLPLLLGILFWEVWLRYIRNQFFLKTSVTLIEVKIPRDVAKSPLAMEIVLTILHQLGGEGTFIARYWEGKVRAWFSLELVSLGGEIKFLMWTRNNMRNLLEAQLYSQYPEIEIREVQDYTMPVVFDPEQVDIWGCEFEYSNKGKNAYPIKTYVDYGLDKDPKEEFKNDPLSSVLEFLGSIKEGEQVWVQFITRAHKKEKRSGALAPATDWQDEAKNEIKEILKGIKDSGRTQPTEGERERISSIERSLSKFPYDTGIRAVYVARKDVYSATTVNGIRGLFRQFSSNWLNGLKATRSTDFDYPWQDYNNIRVNRKKRKILDAYKRRMYFFAPYKHHALVMTNEELATLYHFPGVTAATPGLNRIPSKKAQAPTNLPI